MAVTRRILIKKVTSNSIKRLVVTAESLDGSVTEYIFKYYRKPLNPLDSSGIRDVLVSVCNASELQTLPIQAPDDDSSGYFRTNVVDVTYVSVLEAEIAWEDITAGVEALIAEIKATDNLGIESQIIIGDTVLLYVRNFAVNALLKRLGKVLLYYNDAILRKTTTLSFGAEGSIGTYIQPTLSYSSDSLLKGTFTKTFECRCNLSQSLTKTYTVYADVGRFTKSYTAGAVLKGTLVKLFNANSVLKAQFTKTYSTDARLV